MYVLREKSRDSRNDREGRLVRCFSAEKIWWEPDRTERMYLFIYVCEAEKIFKGDLNRSCKFPAHST
jgi:hypothetical protein